jgi:ABC-type nitrate/sulfonate/bicarbonate transport system substrate-binding protein
MVNRLRLSTFTRDINEGARGQGNRSVFILTLAAANVIATTADVNRNIHCTKLVRRKHIMSEAHSKNWRALCSAAREAKDPDELLKIVQELNRALKHEEQVRRDFREARRASRAAEEIRC